VSRHLKAMGHEVIVANPRRTRLIAESSNKQDRLDAETLARLARVDPKMLFPIRHRGEAAQADLAMIRARAALVEARTRLINTARGLTKSFGERLRHATPDTSMGAWRRICPLRCAKPSSRCSSRPQS